MAHGFVYLLENDAMPGLVKIGYSMRHPKQRLAELSYPTSCPLPFDLLAWFGCPDPSWVERQMHAEMAAFRVSDKREFFRMNYRDAQELVRRWCDPYDDVAFLRRLDMLAMVEAEDERIAARERA
jgi:hypothetical protein